MATIARRIAGLTLVLGATVVVSWVAVRGTVLHGPGPFLDSSWFAIWALQAALAVVVGVVFYRAWGRDASAITLGGIAGAAWVGELLVVTAIAPFLADELSPASGPWIWLIATGGPIQPLAAAVGSLIASAATGATRPASSD
jgi:hypothetical protein